jgi:hypothetical protein
LFDRRWLLLADVAAERVIPIEQLELLTPVQQAAVIEAGLANGSAFIGATRTRSQREALEPVIRVGAEDQLRVRRVVRLMQAFKISETTAVTLVAAGLDAPSEVERASRVRLREVFADLSKLPEPFRLRQLSSEFADWLATQEA